MGRRRRNPFKTFMPTAGVFLLLASLIGILDLLVFERYSVAPWIPGALFTVAIYAIGMIVYGIYRVRY
jgi:uncharacterized membrane protein SirB2